jgi:hypothetical protein
MYTCNNTETVKYSGDCMALGHLPAVFKQNGSDLCHFLFTLHKTVCVIYSDAKNERETWLYLHMLCKIYTGACRKFLGVILDVCLEYQSTFHFTRDRASSCNFHKIYKRIIIWISGFHISDQ